MTDAIEVAIGHTQVQDLQPIPTLSYIARKIVMDTHGHSTSKAVGAVLTYPGEFVGDGMQEAAYAKAVDCAEEYPVVSGPVLLQMNNDQMSSDCSFV